MDKFAKAGVPGALPVDMLLPFSWFPMTVKLIPPPLLLLTPDTSEIAA